MRHWMHLLPVTGLLLLTACAGTPGAVSTAASPEVADIDAVNGASAALPPEIDFRHVVRTAKDRVFPAVVFVKCIRESVEGGRKQSREVAGSGVIVSPTGEVVTNWHVVDKATDIRCLLTDGRAMQARLVGTDKDTDLALLQLDVPAGVALPHALLGETGGLEEGDFVMAMGAPWGLSRSVAIGIIACTRRYLPGSSEYSLWLQSDCAISPGNSGGPLVNTAGEVIGINSRGVLEGGDMAFAIPAETVRLIVDSLRAHGHVDWTWFGLQLQPLRDFNRDTYFDGDDGVLVAGTDPESPARRAGLQPRDRIVRVNGASTTALTEEDLPDVRRGLGRLPKDAPVVFDVLRGDEPLQFAVTPRAKGRVEGEEYECRRWDMSVKTINQFDNPSLHYYRAEGVFIYGVKYPGNAYNARLSTSDILLRIGEHEVRTLDDVRARHEAALANIAADHRVVLTVLRNGLERQVVLDFSRDYQRE